MTLSPDSPMAYPSISPPLIQNSTIFISFVFAIFPPELDGEFIKNRIGIICFQYFRITSGPHA